MKYGWKIHLLRVAIATIGMLGVPVISVLALVNPLIKDFGLVWFLVITNLIMLSWFMAENLNVGIIKNEQTRNN